MRYLIRFVRFVLPTRRLVDSVLSYFPIAFMAILFGMTLQVIIAEAGYFDFVNPPTVPKHAFDIVNNYWHVALVYALIFSLMGSLTDSLMQYRPLKSLTEKAQHTGE